MEDHRCMASPVPVHPWSIVETRMGLSQPGKLGLRQGGCLHPEVIHLPDTFGVSEAIFVYYSLGSVAPASGGGDRRCGVVLKLGRFIYLGSHQSTGRKGTNMELARSLCTCHTYLSVLGSSNLAIDIPWHPKNLYTITDAGLLLSECDDLLGRILKSIECMERKSTLRNLSPSQVSK